MSFPCGLEHLRRCTGSTRWWSVDCGIYANRGTLALFISLGRFRLIGTYNQFFYTPQSSQSHSYLLASPFPCAIADLSSYSKPSYLPERHLNPHAKHLSLFITASYSSLRLHFSSVLLVDSCCRRNTTHLVHVMTCILPLSFFFFSKSFIFFLAFRRTMHDPFMFSTLRFILHDPPCIAYSLRLLSSSKLFISTR